MVVSSPTDPFALVERATEPRCLHMEWEDKKEPPKGKGKAKGARESMNYIERKRLESFESIEKRRLESKEGPSKSKGARGSIRYKIWEQEERMKRGESAKWSRFRLRCMSRHLPNGGADYNRFRSYWRIDFHTVDLEKGELYVNSLPPMIGRVSSGDMVSLGSKIYMIGGLHKFNSKAEPYPLPDDMHHQHLGASCLDLSSSLQKWEQTACPEVYNLPFSCCVSLCGKIYSFGDFNCCPEVYDPRRGGQWKKLSVPSDLDNCEISLPVLPDTANKRILVHLEKRHQLFAFYPRDNAAGEGEWKLITNNFVWEDDFEWEEDVKAVADNIIYFYLGSRNLVRAYDITKAMWLTCVWSSEDFDLGCFDTITPCRRNKGIMYLVGSSPAQGETFLVAAFLKFRVKRINNSKLELSPISLQCFKIPSTIEVKDFLTF